MKERKRFLLYCDWENLIQDMSDSDIASLTKGIFKYQNTGEIPEMTYGAKLAFSFMRPVFDEDRKDWEETSKTNSKNAKERWEKMRNNATAYESMQTNATAYEPMRPSTDSDIDSVSDNDTVIDTIDTDIPKGISSQAIVPSDNRNKGTQRIVDIIKNQVEQEGFLYDNNPEERNRATIIAKRQSDWGRFIRDATEEREEEIIRSIISYSNQNEYTSKIRSCKDFHEKWKKVANTMKEEVKKQEKIYDIPSF